MLDTSRAFTGPAARKRLVQGIRDGGAEVIETDWLEWKSQANLSAAEWPAIIGLYVLGFANRMPDAASRWAEGYGYLVLGAEPGSVTGIAPLDPADLESRVEPYVGQGGPRWEPHYVEIDGVVVLVVEVAPPKWGDGPHPLRKEFGKRPGTDFSALAGEIFVRRGGKTPRAGPREIDALTARAKRSENVLAVHVRLQDSAMKPRAVDLSDEAREAWLSTERGKLLSQFGLQKSGATFDALTRSVTDGRSPEQFSREVNEYIAEARSGFSKGLRMSAVRRRVGRLNCLLVNDSDDNFANVKTELEVAGDVTAYFDAEDVDLTFEFPSRPRSWGSSMLAGWNSTLARLSTVAARGLRQPGWSPPGWVENEGPTRVRFRTFELRPRHEIRLPEVQLIVGSQLAGGDVVVRWIATATNVSGVAEGEFHIAIDGSALSPAELLADAADQSEPAR